MAARQGRTRPVPPPRPLVVEATMRRPRGRPEVCPTMAQVARGLEAVFAHGGLGADVLVIAMFGLQDL